MKDPLATYVHDHLAGARFGLDALGSLRDQHAGDPLGQLAADLHREIEQDRAILGEIADRLDAGAPALKNAGGWLAEKFSRLKLGDKTSGKLGTFETLEALALGILGKLALWQALGVVAQRDERLTGYDFEQLAARARAQHVQVEGQRLLVAREALAPTQGPTH